MDSPFVFERLSWFPKVMAESSGKWISCGHSNQMSANALHILRGMTESVWCWCVEILSKIGVVESS